MSDSKHKMDYGKKKVSKEKKVSKGKRVKIIKEMYGKNRRYKNKVRNLNDINTAPRNKKSS